MKTRITVPVILAGLISATSSQAAAYTSIFAFGDSLSDAGNIAVVTAGTPLAQPLPPYSGGRFSNGPVWVQDLAQYYGLPMLTASLLGGTDYAYGSAQTGPTAVNPTGPTNALDLPAQVTQFLASYPTAPSSALYTVAIGSNDLLGVLGSANPVATAAVVVPQAVQNIDRSISTLAAAGAKDFLVLDVSDLGLTPDVEALGSVASAGATTLSTEFNTALNASVSSLATADGLDLTIFNLQALTDAVVNDPAAYGFTNVTQPCFTGTATGGPSSGTLCGTSLAEQDEYLYWDGLHPTAAGQAGIAAGAEQAIPEPGAFVLLLSGLSFLLVTCRLSRCASTQRRISANL